MISGYLFQIPAERAARHELLMKPMRPQELIDAVERLLRYLTRRSERLAARNKAAAARFHRV